MTTHSIILVENPQMDIKNQDMDNVILEATHQGRRYSTNYCGTMEGNLHYRGALMRWLADVITGTTKVNSGKINIHHWCVECQEP